MRVELLAAARADAVRAGLHIQVVRAYVNAIAVAADARDSRDGRCAVGAEALALFDERELRTPGGYVMVVLARSLLDRGRWDEALEHAGRGRGSWHGGLALADMRRGARAPAAWPRGATRSWRGAAEALAGVPDGARHGLVRAALAEAAWLRGDRGGMREHALAGLERPARRPVRASAGELALWAARAGATVELPPRMHEPVRRELAGDWRGAIGAWRALDAPYEAALAALPATSARPARRWRRCGASAPRRRRAPSPATARRTEPRALRGPRRSTLANAAGLTRREQEVLEHVAAGATNADIAAALHLSIAPWSTTSRPSSRKLGATTRTAAVDAARAAGVLSGETT